MNRTLDSETAPHCSAEPLQAHPHKEGMTTDVSHRNTTPSPAGSRRAGPGHSRSSTLAPPPRLGCPGRVPCRVRCGCVCRDAHDGGAVVSAPSVTTLHTCSPAWLSCCSPRRFTAGIPRSPVPPLLFALWGFSGLRRVAQRARGEAVRWPPRSAGSGWPTSRRNEIRHIEWQLTGTIRVIGDVTEIRWDDVFGDYEISNEGPVFPVDVEIITGGAS